MDTDPHKPDILVLYASQTGTAQYVAEEVTRELIHREFSALCLAMDDFDITELPNQKHVIFIVATAGP